MKTCRDCSNCDVRGTCGTGSGTCVVRGEKTYTTKPASVCTDFKDSEVYGSYGCPVIFSHRDGDDSDLNLSVSYDDYVVMSIDEEYYCNSTHMSRESLELLANNILDFLNGKEIKYPSIKVKNEDF